MDVRPLVIEMLINAHTGPHATERLVVIGNSRLDIENATVVSNPNAYLPPKTTVIVQSKLESMCNFDVLSLIYDFLDSKGMSRYTYNGIRMDVVMVLFASSRGYRVTPKTFTMLTNDDIKLCVALLEALQGEHPRQLRVVDATLEHRTSMEYHKVVNCAGRLVHPTAPLHRDDDTTTSLIEVSKFYQLEPS